MTENCLAWHKGCEVDIIRNDFIIPLIVRLVDENRYLNLLDVGSSTGYISQKVKEECSPDLQVDLVDRLKENLSFARKIPILKNSIFYNTDYFKSNNKITKTYDIIVLSNVLLEVDLSDINVELLKDNLSVGGVLVVSHPDTLLDLFQSVPNISDATLSDYTLSCVKLDKVDKFTGRPYPFVAHRVSTLVERFVSAGLKLCRFERAPGDMGHMCLVFER